MWMFGGKFCIMICFWISSALGGLSLTSMSVVARDSNYIATVTRCRGSDWQLVSLTLWLFIHVDMEEGEPRLVTHTQLLIEHLQAVGLGGNHHFLQSVGAGVWVCVGRANEVRTTHSTARSSDIVQVSNWLHTFFFSYLTLVRFTSYMITLVLTDTHKYQVGPRLPQVNSEAPRMRALSTSHH